jgi:hypothetical protein
MCLGFEDRGIGGQFPAETKIIIFSSSVETTEVPLSHLPFNEPILDDL